MSHTNAYSGRREDENEVEQHSELAPQKHKHDVILEFHSSPDAILNALHQAGWQVIPKAQPQRSEQQEWTPKYVHDMITAGDFDGLRNAHNAELDAECQRTNHWAKVAEMFRVQLRG